MNLPSQSQMLLPLLEAIHDAGGIARPGELYDEVAKRMGLANEVRSPSFQLLRLYRSTGCQLAHADAYRMALGELADLGLEELLGTMAVAVEWGERLGLERWPGSCWLAFEHLSRGRRVTLRSGPGHLARALEP